MTRLMATIRTVSAQIWAWLKPGGPWLGLRRFVGAMLVLAAFVTFGQTNSPLHAFGNWVTGSGPGQITLSQPLVYTRERLVDDRLEQINWLNQRLRALDRESDPDFQSTEGRIERSRMIGASRTTETGASGGASAVPGGEAPTAQSPQPILETTMSRFQQMSLYREALRAERMRAILDDRHDIAGNTVFQLSFEATVLPSPSGKGAGIVALQVKEDNEGKSEWSELPGALKHEYERLFRDWITHLRQEMDAGIEGRITALEAQPQGVQPEGPSAVLRALRALVCSSDPRVREMDEGGWINLYDAIDDCQKWSLSNGRLKPGRYGFQQFVTWLESELKKAKDMFEEEAKKSYAEKLEASFRDPQVMQVMQVLDEGGRPSTSKQSSLRIREQTQYEQAIRMCRNVALGREQSFYVPFTEYERAVIETSVLENGNFVQNGHSEILRRIYRARILDPTTGHPSPAIQLSNFNPPLSFPCPARYLPFNEAQILLALRQRVESSSFGPNEYFFNLKLAASRSLAPSVIKIETSAPALCAATYARYHEAREQQKNVPPIHSVPSQSDDRKGFRLSELVTIAVNEPFAEDCQLQIEAPDNGAQKLYEKLRNPHRQTFTYGLSPRNEAKRFETVTDALFQARLSVPMTALGQQDFDAWYSTLERAVGSQERTSIAGFSNDKSFGWVFLPTRLGLEEKHRLETRTVQAILSLPAYWRRVHIKLARCWTHEGQYDAVRNLFHRDFFALNEWEKETLTRRAGCQISDLHIRIPGAEAEVQRALNLEILRTPFVKPSSQEELIAYEGRPASFRLSGGRLWRSTTVTLGGQYADRIRVLPDMRGIIAEFDCVNHPSNAVVSQPNSPPRAPRRQGIGFDESFAYLAVWTSEGTTQRTTLPVSIRRVPTDPPHLSCRDIKPAPVGVPVPQAPSSAPSPPATTGETRR